MRDLSDLFTARPAAPAAVAVADDGALPAREDRARDLALLDEATALVRRAMAQGVSPAAYGDCRTLLDALAACGSIVKRLS